MGYQEQLRLIKLGLMNKTTGAKPKKPIPKVSEKRKQELAKVSGDSEMDLFFERNRKKMTGICQCGCGQKSQKNDDTFYRGSICHIFPKRIFKSIADNDYNWVERTMFGGCHSQMDDSSIAKWVNFVDWEDIKERFHILAPLLTDAERKTKFYHNLEKLIYDLH